MKNTILFILAALFCTCGNTIIEKEAENPVDKIEIFDIAFEDEYGLCAANLKTGKKTLVDPEGKYGCISKDGKQIAYTKKDKLYIMDFDTRKMRLINTSWKNIYTSVWSPDNKQIAFYAYSDSKTYIGVTRKDYKEITTIATTDQFFGGPSWTPDSKGIIYSDYYTIYISDLSGNLKKQYKITDLTTQFTIANPQAMLTPNGRYFIYLMIPDNYVMKTPNLITLGATDLQTMKWRQITPRDMGAEDPFMDEAGNIYFRGGKYRDKAIYRISINDSVPKEIAKGMTGFSIRNNVKVSFPIKLTSCDNCPEEPARAPIEYKEEVPLK